MKIFFNLKHYLYSGLREVLVYHHNSLEFRAKLFALIIAANPHPNECEYNLVFTAGMQIYKDEERVKMLVINTKEYVKKVHSQNSLNIDGLVEDLLKEVRQIPRYASKIDTSLLMPIVECCVDEDTSTYQIRMIEFLNRLKKEYSNDA